MQSIKRVYIRFYISQATLEDYYIDDFLSGTSTIDELTKLYDQMNELMKSGGFELDKWNSNYPNILGQKSVKEHEADVISETGVLGMVWNPENDKIKLKITDLQSASIVKSKSNKS